MSRDGWNLQKVNYIERKNVEERGTMGEIKSLALVISGGDGKFSPKKNLGLCKKKKVKMLQLFRERRDVWKSCENVVLLFETRLCSYCSNLCKKNTILTINNKHSLVLLFMWIDQTTINSLFTAKCVLHMYKKITVRLNSPMPLPKTLCIIKL